ATVRVQVYRIHDLDVLDRIGQLAQGGEDRDQPTTEALATMRRDEDDAAREWDAVERTRREVVVATCDVAERVDHRVSGDVDGPRVRGFAEQVLFSALRRFELEGGEEP